MARLGIKRANGDIEYAELTTDKSLVGSHYLTVERYGTPYYAKLGDSVSTHLCVEGSDGQKRYVQKEVKFVWKYIVDSSHPIDGFVIPRTGKYRIEYDVFKHILPVHEQYDYVAIKEVNLTKGDRPYDGKIGGVMLEYSHTKRDDNNPEFRIRISGRMTSIEYVGD